MHISLSYFNIKELSKQRVLCMINSSQTDTVKIVHVNWK